MDWIVIAVFFALVWSLVKKVIPEENSDSRKIAHGILLVLYVVIFIFYFLYSFELDY